MTQVEHQRYQEQTFDSYMKRLIRNESRNAKKELARRAKREISLSQLLYDEKLALAREDQYHVEGFVVHIRGGSVSISDYILGRAVFSLVPKWREVIVMYYFFDMSDKEIGEVLQLTTAAIRHRRMVALKRLKMMMEDLDYEK